MKIQAESFHLNGQIIGFRPQTQKLESLYKTPSNTGSESVNSDDLLYIYSINPLSGVYLDLFFQWLYIIFQTVTRLFTKIKLQKWGIHSADFEKVSENEIQQSFVVVVKRF